MGLLLTALFYFMVVLCITALVLVVLGSSSQRVLSFCRPITAVVNWLWTHPTSKFVMTAVLFGCAAGAFASMRIASYEYERAQSTMLDMNAKTGIMVKVFRSQRNAYLYGITAFLMLLVSRLCVLEERARECTCHNARKND